VIDFATNLPAAGRDTKAQKGHKKSFNSSVIMTGENLLTRFGL